MALVNFEAVAAAADALQSAGQRPSVRAVIAHLGGGSPNAVLKFLAAWKTGQPMPDTHFDHKTRTLPSISVNLEPSQRSVVALAAAAQQHVAAIAEDVLALAQAHHIAEQQIKDLSVERDLMRQQLENLTRQLRQAQEDAERSQQYATEQTAALAKAEVRLEALPDLHAEINDLRTALNTESKARAAAELQAAVSEARLEVGERYAGATQERASKAEQQAAIVLAKFENAARELSDAKQTSSTVKKSKL